VTCSPGPWAGGGSPREGAGKLSDVCSVSRTLTFSVTGIFIAIFDFQYLLLLF